MGKRNPVHDGDLLPHAPAAHALGDPAPKRQKKHREAKVAVSVEDSPEMDSVAQPATAGGGAPPLPSSGQGRPEQPAVPQPQPAPQKPDGNSLKSSKPAPVLPWMRVPVAIEAFEGILLEEVRGLDARLKAALEATGIEVLFPVQTVVWQETAGGSSTSHDICISAPTGSGKTLSYALPVLQALSRRTVPGLRALVVLPTRDLAMQVYQVLASLCPALGLTACVACGKASLAAEAEVLAGGAVDILVATPGRLISHLEGTPGFAPARLAFLVIDETDRLLRQAYQDWLPKLLAAVEAAHCGGSSSGFGPGGGMQDPMQGPLQQQQQWDAQGAAALPGSSGSGDGSSGGGGSGGSGGRVVKFVVSATLTRDPSKLERLGLHCPRYIAMSAVDHRYKLPQHLQEFKLVIPADQKPLALAALLCELRGEQTIVFTSSVEASHRLCLLLKALQCLPDRVVEFSSMLRPEERRAALEDFRNGTAMVLVCSDAMTRGMDVEGVANVVNYDSPVYVKTYVHRAGRTARAGRSGRVVTMLRHEDVKHFKGMLRKADNTYVRDHRLDRQAMEGLKGDVDQALQRMQEWVLDSGRQTPGLLGAVTNGRPKSSHEEQAPARGAAKRRKIAGVKEFVLLSC